MSANNVLSSRVERAAMIGTCFSLQGVLISSYRSVPGLPIRQFLKFNLHPPVKPSIP